MENLKVINHKNSKNTINFIQTLTKKPKTLRNNANDMLTTVLYNNVGTTYITNNKGPTMVVI